MGIPRMEHFQLLKLSSPLSKKECKCHFGTWIWYRDIYDAMNKGVLIAMGEWINFINGGDRFASHDVLKRVFHISFNADLIYSNTYVEYSGQSILKKKFSIFFF